MAHKKKNMKKIKSLFKRDYKGTHLVYDEVVEGCEWVQNGEGIATRKWDGACCKIENGQLFKRYDRKLTKAAFRKKKGGFKGPWIVPDDFKPAPDGWIAAQEPDPVTGHWPGWLLVGDGPEDQYFREAYENNFATDNLGTLNDGTYELVGPKVNGNKDQFEYHVLVRHGCEQYSNVPTDFEGLKNWLATVPIEGLVWHHPDGRMVKIKRSDFGYKW